MGNSAPGWYPDPAGSGQQRYFDGNTWTDQYGQPPAPPPPPQKKSRKVWLIVAAVVVVIIGISLANGSNDSAKNTPAGSASSNPSSSTKDKGPAPAGTAVRDGKFEFQVLDVSNAKAVSDPTDNPYMRATAQGTFIVLTVNVRNIGDKPQNYFGANQKLVDVSGRQYGLDTTADTYMNSGKSIMGEINPGNQMQVKMAFDVPPGTQAQSVQFHDSMFSDGASVAIQ